MREHVWKYWPRLLATIVCMALVAGTTVAMARLMQPIIDDVFIAKDRTLLLPIASAVFAVFLIKGLATYGQSVLLSDVGRRVIAERQERMFGRLMHADQIGRASCRERVCQYVEFSVVAVSLKKKTKEYIKKNS